MNTEQEHARLIAERIARRVSASQPVSASPTSSVNVSAEIASLHSSLSELQKKLARLEARVGSDTSDYASGATYSVGARSESRSERPAPLTHSPWLAGVNATAAHPSQETFGVEEAAVSELVDFFEKEKTCTLELGGKPCDHCAMCSSRGF